MSDKVPTPTKSQTKKEFNEKNFPKKQIKKVSRHPRSALRNLYDADLSNQSIFWTAYSETEQEKRKIISDSNNAGYTSGSFIKAMLTFSLHKYIYSHHLEKCEENSFRSFFLEKFKYVAIVVLLCSLGFLSLLDLYLIKQYQSIGQIDSNLNNTGSNNVYAKSFLYAMLAYSSVWLCLNLICLVYFLFFLLYKKKVRDYFHVDIIDIWPMIGNCILATRFFIIVVNLTYYFEGGRGFFYGSYNLQQGATFGDFGQFNNETSLSIDGHINSSFILASSGDAVQMNDSTFEVRSSDYYAVWFLFFQILIDYFQALVLSTMPFPAPWTFLIGILMSCDLWCRVLSCQKSGYLALFVESNILNSFILSALMYFLVLLPLMSFTFERSVRESFHNICSQKKATSDIVQMVNLLCREVKVPVQQVHMRYRNLDNGLPKVKEHRELVSFLNQTTGHISTLVDDLLFLVRVNEKRFQYQYRDTLRLKSFLSSVTKMVSYSRAIHDREWSYHVNVPDIVINTDKNCLRILLFNGITTMLKIDQIAAEISNSNKKVRDKSKLTISGTIEALSPSIDTRNRIGTSRYDALRFELIRETAVNQSWKASHFEAVHKCELLQALFMTCQTVLSTFGGIFEVNERKMTFTLPVLISEYNNNDSDADDASVSTERSSFRESIDDPRLLKFLSEKVLIYITDTIMQDLLLDSVQRLPGGNDISVVKALNSADLLLRDVVFVQSIVACLDLREKKFAGKIVLCSERLTYLDREESEYFNFGVSLPAQSSDVQALLQYLSLSLISGLNPSIAQTNDIAIEDKKDISADERNKSFVTVSSKASPMYLTRALTMGILVIPPERLENYAKWRFLNPGNVISHHSISVEFLGVISLTAFAIQTYWKLANRTYFFAIIFLYCTQFLQKRIHDNILVKVGIPFKYFWYSTSALSFVMFVASLGFDFAFALVRFQLGPWTYPSDKSSLTFSQFLSTRFGAYDGIHMLTNCMDVVIMIKLIIDTMPWPVSFFLVIMSEIRLALYLEVYFRQYLAFFSYKILFGILVALSLVLVILSIAIEWFYRREFSELYDLIMSREFLNRCLTISRELLVPLNRLVNLQESMVNDCLVAAVDSHILIDKELSKSIELMNHNILVSKELIFTLSNTDPAVFKQPKASFLKRMKACLLRNLVVDACSKFLDQNGSAIDIHIFVRLYPELTMVRVDPELFSALLSKVCRTIIGRIQENIESDKTKKSESHSILVWISPTVTSSVQRFTDVRALQITVTDTSEWKNAAILFSPTEPNLFRPAAKRAVATAFVTGGLTMVDKYMEFFSFPFQFEAGALEHPQYRSFQKLFLPYLLCLDSHSFSELQIRESGRIDQVKSSSERFYPIYFSEYGGSAEERGKISSRRRKPLHTKILSTFGMLKGSAAIFCHQGSELSQNTWENQEIFGSFGWVSKSYFPRHIPRQSTYRDVHCVIIEHSKFDNDFSHGDSSKSSFNARLMVHHLRADGFLGLIVTVYSKHYDMKSEQAAKDLISVNPFQDAEYPDMHIQLPLTKDKVSKVIFACEKRLIKLATSSHSYITKLSSDVDQVEREVLL